MKKIQILTGGVLLLLGTIAAFGADRTPPSPHFSDVTTSGDEEVVLRQLRASRQLHGGNRHNPYPHYTCDTHHPAEDHLVVPSPSPATPGRNTPVSDMGLQPSMVFWTTPLTDNTDNVDSIPRSPISLYPIPLNPSGVIGSFGSLTTPVTTPTRNSSPSGSMRPPPSPTGMIKPPTPTGTPTGDDRPWAQTEKDLQSGHEEALARHRKIFANQMAPYLPAQAVPVPVRVRTPVSRSEALPGYDKMLWQNDEFYESAPPSYFDALRTHPHLKGGYYDKGGFYDYDGIWYATEEDLQKARTLQREEHLAKMGAEENPFRNHVKGQIGKGKKR